MVKDANGQSLAYIYGRESGANADTAMVLTIDEARRIANNLAKLPTLLTLRSCPIARNPAVADPQRPLMASGNKFALSERGGVRNCGAISVAHHDTSCRRYLLTT